MNTRRIAALIVTVVAVAGVATACNDTKSSSNDTRKADQQATANGFAQLQQAQPTPNFTWSQLRQNLIDIETAQANTVQTTSFFYNQGVQTPVSSCLSIGYPIPADSELTNPEQIVDPGYHSYTAIPQGEVTGIYTGPTTGTHVVCVDATGKGYDNYWEGNVQTVTGPAHFDKTTGQVVLDGAPTAAFSTGNK